MESIKRFSVSLVLSFIVGIFLIVNPADATSWRELIQEQIDKCDRERKADFAACKKRAGRIDIGCLQDTNADYDSCVEPSRIRKLAKAARLDKKKEAAREKATAALEKALDKCKKTRLKKYKKCERITDEAKQLTCVDKVFAAGTRCNDKAQAAHDKKLRRLE